VGTHASNYRISNKGADLRKGTQRGEPKEGNLNNNNKKEGGRGVKRGNQEKGSQEGGEGQERDVGNIRKRTEAVGNFTEQRREFTESTARSQQEVPEISLERS